MNEINHQIINKLKIVIFPYGPINQFDGQMSCGLIDKSVKFICYGRRCI